jgi:hypothetical protein
MEWTQWALDVKRKFIERVERRAAETLLNKSVVTDTDVAKVIDKALNDVKVEVVALLLSNIDTT